jgi:hypothetical protein
MAFEAQAGFQFIGHELKVGRFLKRQELLEKAQDFGRPVRPTVAPRELGGEPGALLEEAGAEPVKMGTADLEVVAGISDVNLTLVELPEDLLEKGVGQTFCDLLLLIAPSQSHRCPLVEGFRRPSLRSGLLTPRPRDSSLYQLNCLLLNSLLSPFVPAPTDN